jgi:general L-amino acid transport system permease protein
MKTSLRLHTLLWWLLAALLAWPILNWAIIHAVWLPDLDACKAVRGSGACWGVIAEKHRILLFGRYPYTEQWRALIATLLLIGMLGLATRPYFWRRQFTVPALLLLSAPLLLMHGGFAGLSIIPSKEWGGLPLTLMVSMGSTLLAFPFAVVLALGRRSDLIVLRNLCIGYIELVRGVPLISLLFLAAFLFPMLLPSSMHVDILPRVILSIAGFAAAYLAEVIRTGLQAVSPGQYEAAQALGMTRRQAYLNIVLPQALRFALPALINNFVGIFKDSSLISIVSLHELTGALSISLGGDADWRSFYLEGYLFIACIYWAFCFGISRFGRSLENQLAHTSTQRRPKPLISAQ